MYSGTNPALLWLSLFVVVGHMFPCFFRFRGGKGVATTGMVILLLNPIVFPILFGIFAIIVLCTKYVSLASVMGVCLYPVTMSAFELRNNGSPDGNPAVGRHNGSGGIHAPRKSQAPQGRQRNQVIPRQKKRILRRSLPPTLPR